MIQNTDSISAARDLSHRRHGTVYVLVLIVGMILIGTGLTVIRISRLQLRAGQMQREVTEASLLAESAINQALTNMQSGSWRSDFAHGGDTPAVALGNGTAYFTLYDQSGDDDLTDRTADAIQLCGTGTVGTTVRRFSVLLQPEGVALDSLNSTAHASQSIFVSLGDSLTLVGADATTNGHVTNWGTISGSAVQATRTMPPASTIEYYKSIATPLDTSTPAVSSLSDFVLSATNNPFGEVNPSGVYYLDLADNLTIQHARIEATLVVDVADWRQLTVGEGVHWTAADPSLPALLVVGGCTVSLTGELSEIDRAVNFNPDHTPFNGESDADLLDTYPAVIKGLISVEGYLTLGGDTAVEGVVLTSKTLSVTGDVTITHDPTIATDPPPGYTIGDDVSVMPGSWRWETFD